MLDAVDHAGADENIGERQHPHAADQHHRHDPALAPKAQLRGDPHGQPHGPESGHGFKQQGQKNPSGLVGRQLRIPGQQQEQDQRDNADRDQNEGHAADDGFLGDAFLEQIHPPPTAPTAGGKGRQKGQGRGLDPAAARAGRSAHEHEEDHHGQGGVFQSGDIDRVEAGRPAGDGLEQRYHQAMAEGGPVAGRELLEQGKQDRAAHDEDGGRQQDGFRLDRQAAALSLAEFDPALQVVEHREADPADHDQAAHGDVEQQIPAVAHHAVRKEGETGIAEGRNRMENTVIGGLPPGHFTVPEQGQHQAAGDLRCGCKQHDTFDEAIDIRTGRVREEVLHDHPVPDGNAAANPREEGHRNGHEPQTADLDQGQEDALAEEGEGAPGVHHGQTRHTNARSGCKQGITP